MCGPAPAHLALSVLQMAASPTRVFVCGCCRQITDTGSAPCPPVAGTCLPAASLPDHSLLTVYAPSQRLPSVHPHLSAGSIPGCRRPLRAGPAPAGNHPGGARGPDTAAGGHPAALPQLGCTGEARGRHQPALREPLHRLDQMCCVCHLSGAPGNLSSPMLPCMGQALVGSSCIIMPWKPFTRLDRHCKSGSWQCRDFLVVHAVLSLLPVAHIRACTALEPYMAGPMP